ncbi:hypothetical protein SADUNF_Sadunf16G0303400 [Salix dunnii]|uniref:Uncharacterized protein n=1 Tax=Salix dunnii TaxID=1413687 RepID=A0A835JCK9_9ROSI|nr:hypothetical protein SADUNF_Sadunf16G0303400 [Salix dunnii]
MGSTQNFDSDTDESHSKNVRSQRTESITGFFMQRIIRSGFSSIFLSLDSTTSHPELSLNFLPCSVKIEASTNQGLLLCTHIPPTYRNIPKVYVCKPTTKQWKQIPNPKTRYRNKAIGQAKYIKIAMRFNMGVIDLEVVPPATPVSCPTSAMNEQR